MARVVQQPLPDPPQAYDQAYFFRLVNAVNLFMLQETGQAKAESIAARFVCTAPPVVDPTGQDPNSIPDTSTLPTGTLYLMRNTAVAVGSPGAYTFSIVTEADQ